MLNLIDESTELTILAAMLERGDLFYKLGKLEPVHFFSEPNQNIFTQMRNLFAEQTPINFSSVSDPFIAARDNKTLNRLNEIVLMEPYSFIVDNGHPLPYYSERLIKLSQRREACKIGDEIAEGAADLSNKAYLEQAQSLLMLLNDAYEVEQRASSKELVAKALEELKIKSDPNSKGLLGLSTGIKSLDYNTKGLLPHQYITIAARPGGGKSALAMNITEHVSMELGKPVLYISLEMSYLELVERLILSLSGSPNDPHRHQSAANKILQNECNLIIDDVSGQTLTAIQSRILKVKQSNPDLALVVIDHIGLILPDPGKRYQSKTYEIKDITNRLKSLAKTIQTPIIGLCQMNRSIEGRQDKKPMKSDLRDSGSIEEDSDLIIFITIERGEDRLPTGEALLSIAKQRNGPEMDLNLIYNPAITKFSDKRYNF